MKRYTLIFLVFLCFEGYSNIPEQATVETKKNDLILQARQDFINTIERMNTRDYFVFKTTLESFSKMRQFDIFNKVHFGRGKGGFLYDFERLSKQDTLEFILKVDQLKKLLLKAGKL